MLLVPIRFFLRSGPSFNAAGAVEGHVRVIHHDGPIVDVRHVMHVHVHHRAVVEEGAASPLSASEAYAAVSEAVVDSAVEANVRPPIAPVPAIEATRKAPIARRPEHAH